MQLKRLKEPFTSSPGCAWQGRQQAALKAEVRHKTELRMWHRRDLSNSRKGAKPIMEVRRGLGEGKDRKRREKPGSVEEPWGGWSYTVVGEE